MHHGIANEDSPVAHRTDSASVLVVDATASDFRPFQAVGRTHMSMACSRRPCLQVLVAGLACADSACIAIAITRIACFAVRATVATAASADPEGRIACPYEG